MSGEKTEKATPRRRQEERKKGNIFQSKELVTVASLLAMFHGLRILGPEMLRVLESTVTEFFILSAQTTGLIGEDARRFLVKGLWVFAQTALPMLLLCAAVTIIGTMAQTRMMFSTEAWSFKWERLNPLEGLKKMVSLRSLVELFKALIKIFLLVFLIYRQLVSRWTQIPRLMDGSPQQALVFLGSLLMAVVNVTAGVFLVVAIMDYFYQWWEFEKKIKMSKQDLKDEYKRTEGDPQLKGKIKEKQRQIAANRMMQKIPEADVVIRNPTHFAVAIAYDRSQGQAPRVLAKGADHLALKIIEIAQKHEVVITENRSLARGLYESVDLDQEIPEAFYQPVAEVLAVVYSLKEGKR